MLEGGEAMTPEAFERAGGNRSATHVDLMIGSGELDIDGVRADGTMEPVIGRANGARDREGEWAD